MLHPILDTSNFNMILVGLGIYALITGFISLKIKQKWYLGDALPAFIAGICFGPVGAKLLNVSHWGENNDDSTASDISYGLTRLVIGIQLVKAGYQLPKKYLKRRITEMTICLLPLMAIGWITTSACVMLMTPHVTFLAALIIGSCVTCTDPVLSQAIAKGPFADNYVRRPLREFISSEAGANDGFCFPFLLLGVSLLRYAETPANAITLEEFDLARGGPEILGATDVGRFGGGVGTALTHWIVEGVFYMIILGAIYGTIVGALCRKLLNVSSERKWIDNECFTLVPMGLGLFIVGTCGCFGSDETLACFIAGNMLNWDGIYNDEIQARHDIFNSALESFLNYGIFTYLGAAMPWNEFHQPHSTGITIPRLIGLGFLILIFRRIPAIMAGYRFMPRVCNSWKEALFMGHFGPIGVGAIAYVEYARRLFPDPGQSDREINILTAAMIPVVYWLVFFSIIVHGLSVPALYLVYKILKVPRIHDHPVEVVLLSDNEPLPNNSTMDRQRHSMFINNRFSEPPQNDEEKGPDEFLEASEVRPRRSEDSTAEGELPQSSTQDSTVQTNREQNTREMV